MKKRVAVAMSGGVDSSTAACLLAKQGYEVIGLSMQLPHTGEISEAGCCGNRGIDDARKVAQQIGIPFYALNYEKEFENKVINYFCREYVCGRTPNPCIVCNETVKLGTLLNKAKSFGADYIATGHYSRLAHNGKRHLLKKGKDKNKDQSYFLFSLSQKQLKHIRFPLGDYTKEEVRKLAKEFGLKVHDKPASQEICFINGDYREFLKTRINADYFRSGPIVDTTGKVLGEHTGIAFYTIGQRKGIGAHKKPLYVVEIDRENNKVIVGGDEKLFKSELEASFVNWSSMDEPQGPLKVKARIRYRHKEQGALVTPRGCGRVKVRFDKAQRAITPGQAVVFYDGDLVLGGGWIC
ncbi:MAG: tRNA 2-thiouridine(34) synthase MnmA [bacterium]